MVKKIDFFELFGPPCGNPSANLDVSMPECAQVCAHIRDRIIKRRHTRPQLTTLRKTETVDDIVPIHIQFGVDPSTRCWDIAQKPPKCKYSPLTPIVTKISFILFFASRGPLTPKIGEDTSGTRVRPHAKFGLNRPAGCREIVDNKRTNKNKHTVKLIPLPSL